MLDKLQLRLATISEVQSANRRHRTELHRQLQELQSRIKLAGGEQSPSQSLGEGVPKDQCLEQQNAVNATLADIIALNAQMTELENTLTQKGDLLLEQLAILEACRHPE
jgi:hypothetical protein